MKIFITGGTGFIGKYVVDKLLAGNSLTISVLTRQRKNSIKDVVYVQGDLGDRKLISDMVAECDYIIHMAGCKSDHNLYFQTNVQGTQNIIDACKNKPNLKKLIYLSSVGVIGNSRREVIDEQTACNPENAYEKTKYAGELIVKKYSQQNPNKVVILRPTNVFGENDPEMHLLNLIKKINKQRFYYVGNDVSKYYLNYLYVQEISELIPYVLAHNTKSDLYILNTPTPLAEFITMIKQIISNDTPVRHLPYWPIKLAAACFDLLPKSIVNHPPINSLKLSELTNEKQYSSALIAQELNWCPALSMYGSLHNLIKHYYKIGLLQ